MKDNGGRQKVVKVCLPYHGQLRGCGITLLAQLQEYGIPGYQSVVLRRPGTIIPFLRNDMVEQPPELAYDYLFFVDDDIGGTEQEMRRPIKCSADGQPIHLPMMIAWMKQILDYDLNICGGFYCNRRMPYVPLVSRSAGHLLGEEIVQPWLDHPTEGVHQVATIPTGFMAVKRTVFDVFKKEFAYRQKVIDRYKKERAESSGKLPKWLEEYLSLSEPKLYPPFWVDYRYNQLDQSWKCVGEDVYFCRESRRLGFKVYCDFSIQLPHETQSFVRPKEAATIYRGDLLKIQQEHLEKLNQRR